MIRLVRRLWRVASCRSLKRGRHPRPPGTLSPPQRTSAPCSLLVPQARQRRSPGAAQAGAAAPCRQAALPTGRQTMKACLRRRAAAAAAPASVSTQSGCAHLGWCSATSASALSGSSQRCMPGGGSQRAGCARSCPEMQQAPAVAVHASAQRCTHSRAALPARSRKNNAMGGQRQQAARSTPHGRPAGLLGGSECRLGATAPRCTREACQLALPGPCAHLADRSRRQRRPARSEPAL